jgi:uncharacterized protein YecE (DUF72 family)
MKHYIGTSGWHYDHWRGDFYPEGLAKSKWLEFYAAHFSTVELNNSFYHLPSEKAFATWKNSTPAGFIFAVKVSRFITHIKRLQNIREPLNTFLGRAAFLEEKQGPLLYQLPQGLKRDDQLLEDFLKRLPPNAQNVFEFRHLSWFDDEVYDLLRRYGAGLCIYDMPDFSSPLMATSDFAYLRFHGNQRLYGGNYSDSALEEWAGKIALLGTVTVYAYFNNDIEGFAIRNALTLKRLLG